MDVFMKFRPLLLNLCLKLADFFLSLARKLCSRDGLSVANAMTCEPSGPSQQNSNFNKIWCDSITQT